ncbi:hypothetical protein BKH41_04100 [Helicobacter sp. 12S02232-10]|uniref:hypothetical protein n=1 Tax=Helicobacter sp. 12S02232-10 TaxID=1476197 RepID=UPI000BA6E7AE|nr:hypothetical protein [Helicobacter sp. 12S02232-10]PAF48818.1 hypothetical protein BKH41_04100 [Helicobacter sp. 12S02232-10]
MTRITDMTIKTTQKQCKQYQQFKNVLFKILCLFALTGIFNSVFALMIITDKNIDLSKKQGTLRGKVVFNNKVYPAIAIGTYSADKTRKNVAFVINQINYKNQTHNLQSSPSVIKETKKAKRLPKNSKLILAGENQEEIAQILGLNVEDYKKKGSGIVTGSGSNSSTNSNSSGSQSAGSSSYDPTASPFTSNTSSDFGNGSSSYFPPSNGLNNGSDGLNNPVIVPGDNSQGDAGGASNYSAQYCKAPQYDGTNSMSLSVVDKDGNCLPLKAQRDDTKCEYRYDFNDGVAIKQTQFYYVDKENQTQNIGGCVDLQGDAYRFPLYKDDSKCKLQITDNKGYGGGQALMFQTQILFRGMDGLIHTAADCGDYMNVQEELISYEKDDKNKKLKRMVNQYYIDPKTNQKIYINHGIYSPYEFGYQEYSCGAWEMDDPNLQAYRRTQIKAYDNIAGSYYDITGCDYSNDQGKSGRITMPYIKLANNETAGATEKGDMNGTYDFEIKEALLGSWIKSERYWCKSCGAWGEYRHRSGTNYFNNGYKTTQWKTTYKTTNTGITVGYQRPKQDDEKEASIYYVSKKIKTIDRNTTLIKNELNLDANYMKFYEANEGFYKDADNNTTKQSKEFTDFITKYYRPSKGICSEWNFWREDWLESGGHSCVSIQNYILPTP